MFLNIKLVLFIMLGSLIFLFSCITYNSDTESELPDLAPPANYNPRFIQNVKDVNSSKLKDPKIVLSRIESHGDKIKIYAHLIDDGNSFLSGAANKEFIKYWCKGTILTENIELPVKNFKVRESQKADRSDLAVALVMDHSGSMGNYRAFACQDAAESFINQKKANDYLFLVKYDGRVSIETPMTQNNSALIQGLKKIGLQEFGGITATNDAILASINQIINIAPNYQKVIIVFTDGQDNASKYSQDSIIKRALETNTVICPIDFGYGVNEGYMEKFAEATGGIYHHIYQKEEFELAFEDIYKRFEHFYLIEFDQPEFGNHKFSLKLCLPDKEINDDITFNNVPDIGFINLLKVNFDLNKSDLKDESNEAIDRVVRLMKGFPALKIELRGHTDNSNNTGDPLHNLKLSEKRANAVKQALIKVGIKPERISAIGFGDSKPVADNNTPEGKAANRRTEFIVLSK
jgi:outer membrane protein OmpA-like peptidoglycan-associated protein